MFKMYDEPLPIHSRRYVLPLRTLRSGVLKVAPSRGEEHDAPDTICLYKDTYAKTQWSSAIFLRVFVLQCSKSKILLNVLLHVMLAI